MEYTFVLRRLKRPDIPCLQAALRSNGGGINDAHYSKACIRRLCHLGLLMAKPNQFRGNLAQNIFLVVLTPAGKEFIQEHNERVQS